LKSAKKQVQKYVSRRKEPKKNTEDAVHLAGVRMEKSGQIILNNIVKQYRN
jgi:hypothetical protein